MQFILRRLAFYLVAAWVAITANFFIPRAMPGDAVDAILAKLPNLLPPARKALEATLGQGNQGSLWHQYVVYLGHVFTLNFGPSLSNYPTPVTQIVAGGIYWTLGLVGLATVIAFVLGTALGVIAGWRAGGWLDRSLPAMMFLQATPYFFLALVLIQVLGIGLHWFPVSGAYDGIDYTPGWNWGYLSNVIDYGTLPALTLVVTSVAGWMLQMRNVMVTTIGEDYVTAAQAKGLSNRRVIFSYAARNALLPQLQGFGLALGFVISGALVMEIVFSYPGIGYLLLNAASSKDTPLMQAIFLLITMAVLAANFLVDLVLVFVDPRVRRSEAA
ncbi:MAG TPA: ABC transporter permease [Trebonia sp.]|jgi:peptide/nickel transport system permease protein|nr:ABC transporter permease [Trebonia sp.]